MSEEAWAGRKSPAILDDTTTTSHYLPLAFSLSRLSRPGSFAYSAYLSFFGLLWRI